MKKLLILGGGTAGTLILNKLNRKLNHKEWEISIVDEDKKHYYQPGFLFIPFDIYKNEQVVLPKEKFFPKNVKVHWSKIDYIEGEKNKVHLADSKSLDYDYLIIATGTITCPEETIGLKDKLWCKDIFDFYTYEGAVKLQERFQNWEGGNLVVCIPELPIKCPIAPLEFSFLADHYFTKKGIRDKINITFATLMSGVFTKPIATKFLGNLLEKKNVNVVPDFYLEYIDNDAKKIISYDEQEIPFDLLVIIPVNMGAEMIGKSGLGDDMNFVKTNYKTLQSEKFENIFVIGDATNIPTSKAGSVAHFAGEVVEKNFLSVIEGKKPTAHFDGHANCFIETGYGKATLIDFNYEVEPLPGKYPFPVIGPFGLLKNTRINHWGKLFFKWLYWNILLKGRELPVTNHMSMVGKMNIKNN